MGAEHCWNNAGQRVVVVIVIVIASNAIILFVLQGDQAIPN